MKVDVNQTEKVKGKFSVDFKPTNDFISRPSYHEVVLIDSLNSKVRNWVIGSRFHHEFCSNNQGPK